MARILLIHWLLAIIMTSYSVPASGQTWSVGVSVGAIPTNDFHQTEAVYSSTPNRFQIGPTVRLGMDSGLGFEAGALRKGIDFHYAFGRPGTTFTRYHTEAAAWQFPLLLQYRFFHAGSSRRRVSPYISAGAALRRITGGEQTGENCVQLPTIACTPFSRTELPELDSTTTTGLVIGGGLELGGGFLKLAPEIRYTRWLSRPFTAPVARENQLEVLIRIAGGISG